MNRQSLLYKIILESPYIKEVGLGNGQLGLCIFFFTLFRETQNFIYEDIAEGLVENMLLKINKNLNSDFDDGYLGILWGMNYLAYNDYISIESDTCDEIINKILSINWRFLVNNNSENNIEGLLHCVLSQCLMKNKFPSFPLFDKYFIDSVADICSGLSKDENSLHQDKGRDFLFYLDTGRVNYKLNIANFITVTDNEDIQNISSLGFFNGLSGYYFRKYMEK